MRKIAGFLAALLLALPSLAQVTGSNGGGAIGSYSVLCNAGGSASNTKGCATVPGRSLIWQQLRQGYLASRYNNPHVNAVMSSPPTVTLLSAAPQPNVNTYSSQSLANTFTSAFTAAGGTPFNISAAYYGFPAYSVSATPGNIATTISTEYFRIKVMVDAIDPVFVFLSSTNPVRFIVNGQYVSLAGTVPSNSPSYIQLTFGSRALRQIWIEGSTQAMSGILVRRGETVQPDRTGPRMTVLGDSITNGTGATLNMDSFAVVMADALGISDVRLSGVGGQGVQAVESSGTWNLQQRLNPAVNPNAWVYDAPPSDLFVIADGTNDTAFSYLSNFTAYQAVIQQLLAQYPTTPILVIGCPANNGGPLEVSATTDLAIQAAVAAVNSPLVLYLPDAQRGVFAYETGVGNTTTPTSGSFTLTANPSASTSGTMTAGFVGISGLYTIAFVDGTTKPVTLTNANPAVSWSGAVTESSAVVYFNGLATSVKPFTASIAAGAASANQASNWGFPTGTYFVYFSDGEIRSSSFTNGAAGVTWTNPLLFGASANVYIEAAATAPGDADIYYASGAGPHPNTPGHARRGLGYADAFYALIKNY